MNKRRLMSIIIAAIMVIVPIAEIKVQAKTQQEIDNEIKNNNNKIDALEKEQNEIKAKKNEENSKLDEIEGNLNSKSELLRQSEEKVNEFKKQIDGLQQNIDGIQNEILEVEENIKKNKEEIENKQKEKEEKEEILGRRLRSVYKTNLGDQFLYVLLESKSIGDLISNIGNITSLVKTDNKLIEEINMMKLELEDINKELATKEVELQDKKKVVIVKQDELKLAKTEYDKIAEGYQAQVDELKALQEKRKSIINSLSKEEQDIKNEIAKYKEDNANLENYFDNVSNSGNPSAGGFIKPTPGSITSPYGPRVHPVTGKNSFHTGVDFGAPSGTPIKAAKGGTVTTATYHTAYGNMVIVDHGDGTSTLYAHASKFATSVGKKVSQGQVIAYVGSTGYSTGAHLHFEIRVNGKHVNPMKYL